ncbi:MAG: hypothetical protein ACUVUU_06345 [bacterium]
MRYLIVLMAIMGTAIPSLSFSAGTGAPASNIGKEAYGISLEGEEQIKRVDGDIIKSRRYIGKIIWGMTDCIDIYGKLGASDLRVEGLEYSRLKAAPRSMVWGGGLRYRIIRTSEPDLIAYLDLQLVSFNCKVTSTFRKTVEVGGKVESYEENHLVRYRYREAQVSFIGKWEHRVFSPYGGFALTNVFGHVDRKVQSEIWDEPLVKGNDFRQYGIAEGIMGLDLELGGTGTLSIELRYSDSGDISCAIGLSELTR